MGLYNFRPRFVPLIVAGQKTHTIRAVRKVPDRPGSIMHLYTGLRRKEAKLLMRAPCTCVERIHIDQACGIVIEGEQLSSDECASLAIRDGFESFADMMSFWTGRLPFDGHVYHWDPNRKLN